MGHHPARPYVSRRDFLKRSAVVGLTTAAGPWFWKQLAYAQTTPVEQVHAQFGGDAARQAAFSWMTPGAVTNPFVELRGERLPAETVQYPGYPGFFHHVRVRDLDPSTDYAYVVGHGDEVRSDPITYRTGPAGREPFTFTAFADQGIDDPGPDNIQDVDYTTIPPTLSPSQPPFQAYQNIQLAQQFDPAFHVIAGDLSYANGNQSIWDRWFRAIEPMARSKPWMGCPGNHEIEQEGGVGGIGGVGDSWGPLGYDAYRYRFSLPDNGDPEWWNCWYAFRYGSVQFVSIDNNDVNTEVTANIGYSEGRQAAFVERTLQAARADKAIDFIIVLMHQCAFSSSTKHGSDPGVQEAWLDLFSRYGVDLVLQGHDHVYERSHLLERDEVVFAQQPYVSDVGTMYVVCGNGGGVQEPFGPVQPEWSAFRQDFKVGTVRIEVTPDTGNGTKRLTLGEYWALDGSPIEEGIVLERSLPSEGQPTGASDEPAETSTGEWSAQPLLPTTGGPGGIGMAATAALTAAAAGRAYLRGSSDDEVEELRARREERAERARRRT